MMALPSRVLIPAVFTAAYQGLFCFLSLRFKTDRLTDLAGVSNIAIVALLSLYPNPVQSIRHVAIPVAIVSWAVRLCVFLASRIAKWKVDRRLDAFRHPSAFARFWVVQGIWAYVTALPATLLGASTKVARLTSLDIFGAFVFLAGFALETVADYQKGPQRERKPWPDEGVWRWSRHPNYFGEMLVWWGVYLGSASGLEGPLHIAVLSPIFVSALLLFLSGIPILERGADRRNRGSAQYVRYKQQTSVLLPCPPELYEKLPESVKKTILMDWPIYNSPEILEGESGNPLLTQYSTDDGS